MPRGPARTARTVDSERGFHDSDEFWGYVNLLKEFTGRDYQKPESEEHGRWESVVATAERLEDRSLKSAFHQLEEPVLRGDVAPAAMFAGADAAGTMAKDRLADVKRSVRGKPTEDQEKRTKVLVGLFSLRNRAHTAPVVVRFMEEAGLGLGDLLRFGLAEWDIERNKMRYHLTLTGLRKALEVARKDPDIPHAAVQVLRNGINNASLAQAKREAERKARESVASAPASVEVVVETADEA